MDALTSVLGSVHLKSSLLAQLDSAGDWSIDCEDPRGITTYCILSGGCWFAPTCGDTVRLESGDVLLLPEWHEHRLYSSPDVPAIPVSELGRVERTILRSALWEMLYSAATSSGETIQDAVSLARTYSGDAARRLVNGVLGSVARSSPGGA